MAARKHGMSNTPTYKSWKCMMERCVTRVHEHPAYANVPLDPSWHEFENFYRDMGDKPDGYQLDRIKGWLGYEKDNCRWTTPKHNSQNRKRFKNNNSGRNGVRWNAKRNRWTVHAMVDGKLKQLYWGNDLFEACCIRAAFEIATNYGGWE